ncbi:MAG: hypothetical protein U0527_01085 [Candidatus Eisenbacteria bacterium]
MAEVMEIRGGAVATCRSEVRAFADHLGDRQGELEQIDRKIAAAEVEAYRAERWST